MLFNKSEQPKIKIFPVFSQINPHVKYVVFRESDSSKPDHSLAIYHKDSCLTPRTPTVVFALRKILPIPFDRVAFNIGIEVPNDIKERDLLKAIDKQESDFQLYSMIYAKEGRVSIDSNQIPATITRNNIIYLV